MSQHYPNFINENRLLVMEESGELCLLLKEIGELCGYRVTITQNIYHFKSLYKNVNPSVIILGVDEKEGKGGSEKLQDLFQFLTINTYTKPIVLLSYFDEKEQQVLTSLSKTQGLTILDHLQKPIDVSTLKILLEKAKPPYAQAIEFTEEEILNGIKNEEFVLHYQPKVFLKTNKVMAVEALVRWSPEPQKMIFPDNFIPLVERYNLIKPLTYWVIEKAFQQCTLWCKKNINLTVEINISPSMLNDLTFPDQIMELVKKYETPVSNICFEMTETGVMSQPQVAMDVLTRLRIKGFQLAIDDFGTGYSSLIELYRMPFTEMKIDKSFVLNIIDDTEAWTITKSIIDLGHNLHLMLVAEGVETREIWNKLQGTTCEAAQGYYISQPISAEEFEEWLKIRTDGNLTLLESPFATLYKKKEVK